MGDNIEMVVHNLGIKEIVVGVVGDVRHCCYEELSWRR